MNKDLQNVSDCLGSQDFFAGSSVSFGDFSMFHSLLNIQTLFGEEALAAYPSLVAYCTRMKALNGVSEYLSKRNPKPMNLGKGKELLGDMNFKKALKKVKIPNKLLEEYGEHHTAEPEQRGFIAAQQCTNRNQNKQQEKPTKHGIGLLMPRGKGVKIRRYQSPLTGQQNR